MIISIIPDLHGQVFESAEISGNSYCYCCSEKNEGKNILKYSARRMVNIPIT